MTPCRMTRTTLGLAVLLFHAVSGFCEDDCLVLVVDGHAAARIVVGKDASPAAEFAATELRTYVRKCTGAELPVAHDLLDDDLVEIVVGAGKIASRLGVDAKGLPRDAFKIKAVG